jgi:L-serine dehydratase
MRTSIFEIFRIGIGPSSSHTVGPMRAARTFVTGLEEASQLACTAGVRVELYGSLALTGKGHGTDRAVLLGLMGETPEDVEIERIGAVLAECRERDRIRLSGSRDVLYSAILLISHKDLLLPGHPNGMRFTALDATGAVIASRTYYSVGGGFVVEEGMGTVEEVKPVKCPYPFHTAAGLLEIGEATGLAIWQIVLENEKALSGEPAVRAGIARIWQVMRECVRRGLTTRGSLPGGLEVKRRAPELHDSLAPGRADSLSGLDWLNAWAMAVNEENAAGGRVVTAPTNGAAGVVPAVAHHYVRAVGGDAEEGLFRYFLTAGAIGLLYKENASISGAEVGCQGEVGVACSMAAGALVAALGGTNSQVEHAAEIGMEHNLGMTCDPVAGLVQIPCIERNAFSAVKAVNAARLAMQEEAHHKVSLDQVIRTMYQTGLDMQSKYKETSLGGLAVHVIEC